MMLFSVIFPLAMDLLRPHLSVLAVSLAGFALGCFCVAVPEGPWLLFAGVGLLSFKMFGFGHRVSPLGLPVSLSIFQSLLIISAAATLLAIAAKRISKYDGAVVLPFGTRFFARGWPRVALARYWVWISSRSTGLRREIDFTREAGTNSDAKQAAYLRRLADQSRLKVRSLGRSDACPGEGLWQHARRWDAAWRFAWKPVAIGAVAGGYLLWSALAASNSLRLAGCR